MNRATVLLTAIAWTMALATVGLHLTLGPIQPPRISIRWSEATSPAQQMQIEQELALEAGEQREAQSWTYWLGDWSRENIARIVKHPLVQDTHYVDRATFTLALDASGRPLWVQRVEQFPMTRRIAPWLPTVALGFGVIGIAGIWPIGRRQGGAAHALALITLASLLVRVVLVLSGGQFYWPDESRYAEARSMAAEIGAGHGFGALRRLGTAPLFTMIGLGPAALERVAGEHSEIPGIFFASFSAFNIGLLGLIAVRLGVANTEAVLAAGLLALSSSFFYFARHLVPYDVAMTFGLLALYIGVGHEWRPRSSLLCGTLAGCVFLTYPGYWTLGGAVLLIHVSETRHKWDALRRACLAGLGLAVAISCVAGLSAISGENLVSTFVGFSGTISQGDFDEGWRLPWDYLWHAEHAMMVMWLLGTAVCIVGVRSGLQSRGARVGILGLALIYISLVVCSVVLHEFVVYGRLARQLVPFFCLVTAAALYSLRVSMSRRTWILVTPGVALLLIVQAGFNFATPLRQDFPSDFLRQARGETPARRADLLEVNAKHLYPGPESVELPPRYSVVRQAPHPLQFLPYQYEGYTPVQRSALRSTDISMQLIVVLR